MVRHWKGDPPKFGHGTEMTAVLRIVGDDELSQVDAVAAVRQLPLHSHRSRTSVSAFIYNARRSLARGDVVDAERRAHAFIHLSAVSQPEPAPAARPSRWRRLFPWLLLGGVSAWR